jgi:hypothetical protein
MKILGARPTGTLSQPPHPHPFHRAAASLLAVDCGTAGWLHLAAYMLQSSLGSTLCMQYRFVLWSRRVGLGWRGCAWIGQWVACIAAIQGGGSYSGWPVDCRLHQMRSRGSGLEGMNEGEGGAGQGGNPGCDEREAVEGLLSALDAGALDPDLLRLAAGGSREGQRRHTEAQDALARLDRQAEAILGSWLEMLPAGATVCSLVQAAPQPIRTSGHPAPVDCPPSGSDTVLVCRLSQGQEPLIAELAAGGVAGSVDAVLSELDRIQAGSAASMREVCTDTQAGQKEW